ncbi:MAG: MJ0042-type zinc finger domain-containing protein [Acidobacteriota bacterium]
MDDQTTSLQIRPVSCPICRSAAIVTTAKVPNQYSYWRCTSCGEIWNVLRWPPQPHDASGGR